MIAPYVLEEIRRGGHVLVVSEPELTTDHQTMSLIRELALSAYILRLRAATRRAKSSQEYLRVAREVGLGPLRIAPMQSDHEILGLLRRLERKPPSRVLEIGTARGGTLYLFCQVAATDAHLLSIDIGYPVWKARLFRSFARPAQKIDLLLASSQRQDTVDSVRRHMGQNELDFLYIDGDHRYEAVKSDFELYSPLVAPGGLVAFHDIRSGPPELVGDVPRFWQEIRASFRCSELQDPSVTEGFGIGLIEF